MGLVDLLFEEWALWGNVPWSATLLTNNVAICCGVGKVLIIIIDVGFGRMSRDPLAARLL